MTHKKEWDAFGFPHTDIEITISDIVIQNWVNEMGDDPSTHVLLYDEKGSQIHGVSPHNQDLPIEVGQYKARQYHFPENPTIILTEKL